ncbi:MAG: COG4223 family protein [Hyphomonas sp.]
MTDTSPTQTDPPERPQDEPIDAQFEPAPEPVATPARAAGPGWLGLGVASVLAAVLGAAGGIYGAGQSGGAAPAMSDAVEARLAALTERQEALERQITEGAPAPELAGLIRNVETVSRRLDEALAGETQLADIQALSARIEALETRASGAPAADTESANALESRLAMLEARALEAALAEAAEPEPDPDAERMADAALAFSAIETAAARGAAFEPGYRTLRAAVPEIESVRRLAPFVSGVQTVLALQNSFAAMRTEALEAHDAAAAPGADSQLSWLNRLFGDVVTVRPAEERTDPVTDAFDTAGRAVQSGELSAAVEALSSLDGAPARAAQGWTREANRRITLEAVLDEVRLSLIEPEN